MLAKINWNPSGKQLRAFGWTMLVAFPLFGLLLAWRFDSWMAFYVCLAIGIIFAGASLFIPPLGRPLYQGWMAIGFALSYVIPPIIISLAFYLMLTPMGFLRRLFSKDPMGQQKAEPGATYWKKIDHKTTVRSYERQF